MRVDIFYKSGPESEISLNTSVTDCHNYSLTIEYWNRLKVMCLTKSIFDICTRKFVYVHMYVYIHFMYIEESS